MATPFAPSIAQFPFLHLMDLDPNLGEDGCSTEAGPGYFSTGGDVCFQYGMLAYVSGELRDASDPWERMQDAINNGTYIEYQDYPAPPLPIQAHWVMKDSKRPFGEANLDWDETDPAYHPYPRPKKQCRKRKRSSKEASNHQEGPANTEVATEVAKEVSEATIDSTSSSDTNNDNDDGVSISSSDACMMRALNGETFEGEYYEVSETSSSGNSSDESGLDKKAAEAGATNASQNEESGTSSPFDVLRSSQTENMVSDYISSLSPPDKSVNLTRSYATPVGPSKKKPIMKFTPTNEINGVNMHRFLSALQEDGPGSGEKIEIDDDDESHDGRYIEMDLALGVLEEKEEDEDIALRSESSDNSSQDGEEDVDADAITRLTNVKGKGRDTKGKKAMIEEL